MPVTDLDKAGFFPEDERNLPEAYRRGSMVNGKKTVAAPPGLLTQLWMLCLREWSSLMRDRIGLVARFFFNGSLSVLLGLIFLGVGDSDAAVNANINSRFGAMIIVLLNCMFGSAQPELIKFPAERPVFLREYSTNHYSVVAYFLSRLSMECFITAAQNLFQVSVLVLGVDLLSRSRLLSHNTVCLFFLLGRNLLLFDWFPIKFLHLFLGHVCYLHGQ